MILQYLMLEDSRMR